MMKFTLLTLSALLPGVLSRYGYGQELCRCLSGDECWPAQKTWSQLNDTVDGRLIATVPVGSPCHDPNYDAKACAAIQEEWTATSTHVQSPSSIMQLFFTNQSCDPFTRRELPCQLGNYASYSVNASIPEHVASAVDFARENNIRLVIKNTGHDLFGRSTGAGALSIWTHNMKDIEVLDYESGEYTGPAVRVSAGVSGGDAVEAMDGSGLGIVIGGCPSVGIAGGFIQGGGHSPLSNAFGLGADQALEYEVVTASGEITTASPKKNSDLFWALSGGGPGTFAVVTRATVRAYSMGDMGGARITILPGTIDPQTYNTIIKKFHSLLPSMVDQGATIIYIISSQIMALAPVTVFNSTGEHVRDVVMEPFISFLKEHGVQPTIQVTTLSYRDHVNTQLGPLPWGTLNSSDWQQGGRLVPRWAPEDDGSEVSDVLLSLMQDGTTLYGSVGDFTSPHKVHNAVIPAWRKTLFQVMIATRYSTDPEDFSTMISDQKRLTNDFMPRIKAVTPGSASYMQEGDINEPDWQEAFFPGTYEKLSKIKRKWDPENLFYIRMGIGSEAWDVAADGRMCRKGA